MSSTQNNHRFWSWNIRNVLALTVVIGMMSFLYAVFFHAPTVASGSIENPTVTLILGQLLVGFILVLQFFFRRAEPQ